MTARERYAVIGVFLLAVTFGVFSNLRQNAATETTRVVVCGIVGEAALDRASQLGEYRENPPTTLAGQAQRDAAQRSLERWNDRAERLGCNE